MSLSTFFREINIVNVDINVDKNVDIINLKNKLTTKKNYKKS